MSRLGQPPSASITERVFRGFAIPGTGYDQSMIEGKEVPRVSPQVALTGRARSPPGRRTFILTCLASSALAPSVQAADEAARASAFIREAGNELGGIARLASTPDACRAALKPFLDRVVDLPGLARFCLGRFWAQADPDWRRRYQALFETVILLNVQNRLNNYRDGGSHVVVGSATPAGDEFDVPTTVQPESGGTPLHVTWRVSFASGTPRIADVSAEGVSLRVTLRSDYESWLRQNSNDLDALLGAMQRMIGRS